MTPGGKSRFVLVVTGGMPTSVTGWVGTDTAAGSVMTPASYDAADGDYDVDLVSPSPIPAGSRFFFQTDTNGKKDLGSVAYAK